MECTWAQKTKEDAGEVLGDHNDDNDLCADDGTSATADDDEEEEEEEAEYDGYQGYDYDYDYTDEADDEEFEEWGGDRERVDDVDETDAEAERDENWRRCCISLFRVCPIGASASRSLDEIFEGRQERQRMDQLTIFHGA